MFQVSVVSTQINAVTDKINIIASCVASPLSVSISETAFHMMNNIIHAE